MQFWQYKYTSKNTEDILISYQTCILLINFPISSPATNSSSLTQVPSASGGLFADGGGQTSRQYTVKTTLCPYANTQMPATRHRPLWPSPGLAVISGAKVGTGCQRKDTARESESLYCRGYKKNTKKVLLASQGDKKKRRGKESEYTNSIFSHWMIHGNVPTSVFWTALETDRQQMVYIGIGLIVDAGRHLYFRISLDSMKWRHPLHQQVRTYEGGSWLGGCSWAGEVYE